MDVRQTLIWVKSQLTLGRQDYQWQHEPCLYGWKNGPDHYFTETRTETTVIQDAKRVNLNSLKKDELKDLCKRLIDESEPPSTVIYEQKPVRNGKSVIACEQLNRKCYAMELDPRYCDVIIDRWETFTGKKAELINEQ